MALVQRTSDYIVYLNNNSCDKIIIARGWDQGECFLSLFLSEYSVQIGVCKKRQTIFLVSKFIFAKLMEVVIVVALRAFYGYNFLYKALTLE